MKLWFVSCIFVFLCLVFPIENEKIDELDKESDFLELSNGTLTINIKDFIEISQKNGIELNQAKKIWKMFVLSSEKSKNISSNNKKTQDPINNSTDNEFKEKTSKKITEEITGETTEEKEKYKSSASYYLLMVIMFIGFIFVWVFINNIILGTYFSGSYNILLVLTLVFSYYLTPIANYLQIQLQAGLMPSLIYITAFLYYLVFFHLILMKFNIQSTVTHEKELLDIDINQKGKILMTIYGLGIGYCFSFSCSSQFVQIPFYCFMLYAVNLLRRIWKDKFSQSLQPSLLFSYSVFAALLLIYLYFREERAFHEFFFLIDFRIISYLFPWILDYKTIEFVDFRFFGFLVSILILSTFIPIFIFIRNRNLWNDQFSYETTLDLLREDMTNTQLVLDKSKIYIFFSGIFECLLIVFSLREKFLFGVYFSSFCLITFLGMCLRSQSYIGSLICGLGGFFLLTTIHLTVLIENQFSLSVKKIFFF